MFHNISVTPAILLYYLSLQ